jgi:Ca2+-binding EF-hand superfamily protein
MKNIITSIMAVAALSFTAVAADDAKKVEKKAPNPEAMLKKLDTNSDGSVSLEEFKAGPAGKKDAAKAEEIFKKKDKDSDGKLTKEELAAAPKKKKDQ